MNILLEIINQHLFKSNSQLIFMPFKINISEKSGKTFHLEADAEAMTEKELHLKVQGKEISPDLDGYEFEITGASDKAGFTAMANVEGVGLKKVLLKYGKAMKKKPKKEGKKKLSRNKPKGLRLKKTVRGKVISNAISQINLKVLKQGNKKLEEIFPEQCKAKISEKSVSKNSEKSVEENKPESEKQIPKETTKQEPEIEQEPEKTDSKEKEEKIVEEKPAEKIPEEKK